MSDHSPRLDLPYLQSAQAQKHVTHNEALRILDMVTQLTLVAFDQTVPPALPQEGEVYALGLGASGDWLGHDAELALLADGYWHFVTPRPGWMATQAGTDVLRLWTGSAWVAPEGPVLQNLPGVGVNTTSDGLNRLAVASANTLLTHEGAGHQLKVNKATAGDTASLLFQDDWSGRAEMGLAGDDDFHIKVSADGSTWHEALSIEAGTGTVALALAPLARLDLAALAASKAVTAVDVLVYDTSRDSDGGLWRRRCQHTSWWNETLNTATRGARREFPAVAVIVAEAGKVTIYDGDDPGLPMWKVFTLSYLVGAVSCIAMQNGSLVFGNNSGSSIACAILDFAADGARIYFTAGSKRSTSGLGSWPADLTGFVTLFPGDYVAPGMINAVANDIAMTVLPDAPVDPTTGLPVPTIAVATAGGVSVIKHDGSVVDIATSVATKIAFGGSIVYAVFDTGAPEAVYGFALPASDQAGVTPNTFQYNNLGWSGSSQWPVGSFHDTRALAPIRQEIAMGGGGGLFLSANSARAVSPQTNLHCRITSEYTTGWLPGAVKGAWLASTSTAPLVGGTEADRSANGLALTVTGTITRTAVASGAGLVGYGGWSAANYLEQAYTAGLDFGTGDFCVMGWLRFTGTAGQCVFARQDTGLAGARLRISTAGGALTASSSGATLTGTLPMNTGIWGHVAYLRKDGVAQLYLNGRLHLSAADAATLSNASAVMRLGVNVNGADPFTAGTLALWRIGATAPSAEQIRKIHEDEKALFLPGAQGTLHGASDAVTALAEDPETGLLHVGTSAGRSDFQGLRRIANTTTAVTTAISAVGGMIAEQ